MKNRILQFILGLICLVSYLCEGQADPNMSLAIAPFVIFLTVASVGLQISAANRAAAAQRRAAEAGYKAQLRQSELDYKVKQKEIEMKSRQEASEVTEKRRKKFRQRQLLAAQIAASGVEFTGSAMDIFLRQRMTDEMNAQRLHNTGNERRGLARWSMTEQYKQDVFSARARRYTGYQQASATKTQGYASAFSTAATSVAGNPEAFGIT